MKLVTITRQILLSAGEAISDAVGLQNLHDLQNLHITQSSSFLKAQSLFPTLSGHKIRHSEKMKLKTISYLEIFDWRS